MPLIIVLCGCAAFAVSILRAAWLMAGTSLLPLFAPVKSWLFFRRECAWCKPMRYLGGNPFAKQVTHGMCPKCLAKLELELVREREAVSRYCDIDVIRRIAHSFKP